MQAIVFPLLILGMFSGEFHPSAQFRLSDGEILDLPFRVSKINFTYQYENWEYRANSCIEYRWKTKEYRLDLREAYISWFPLFGEVKFGKQIHAWGATDGNNPTDNMNAYDYYFMFVPGTDRKIGSFSASASLVFENWQIESIIIPKHTPNRMPFGEKDSFLSLPAEPPILEIESPMEFGFRAQTSVFGCDISLSYFNGHDRIFSMLEKVTDFWANTPPYPTFGYRKTNMIGADFVSFFGDFTFRGELGYFQTINGIEEKTMNDVFVEKLETDARYLQYVLQTEWTAPFDILLNLQWIGNKTISVKGDFFDIYSREIVPLTSENFQSGMGVPFAMFADDVLVFSATGNGLDSRIEWRGLIMFNLREAGVMSGVSVDYSPVENWSLEISLSPFFGDENNPENAFTKLEDFSHILFGLKYSF